MPQFVHFVYFFILEIHILDIFSSLFTFSEKYVIIFAK